MAEAEAWRERVKRGRDTNVALAGTEIPSEVRRFCVVRHAQFATPRQIIREVSETYGLDISAPRVRSLDPSRPYNRAGKAMKTLYAEARAAYLADVSAVGIAHQTHRLAVLQRQLDRAEEAEQVSVIQGLLRQAAEEMGGSFTNQRTVTHRGSMGVLHLNADDAKAELAQRLASIMPQLALPCPVVEPEDKG